MKVKMKTQKTCPLLLLFLEALQTISEKAINCFWKTYFDQKQMNCWRFAIADEPIDAKDRRRFEKQSRQFWLSASLLSKASIRRSQHTFGYDFSGCGLYMYNGDLFYQKSLETSSTEISRKADDPIDVTVDGKKFASVFASMFLNIGRGIICFQDYVRISQLIRLKSNDGDPDSRNS